MLNFWTVNKQILICTYLGWKLTYIWVICIEKVMNITYKEKWNSKQMYLPSIAVNLNIDR